MSAEQLAIISGALLSFAFRFPGVKAWYEGLSAENKQWVMLGALALTSLGIIALACSGWGADFGLHLTCDRGGAVSLLIALVGAITANQGVYSLTRHLGRNG